MTEVDDDTAARPPARTGRRADAIPSRPRRPLVPGEIVARRGLAFLLKRCLAIPLLLVFGGGYFLYDGFIGWPGSNQKIADLTQTGRPGAGRGRLERRVDTAQPAEGDQGAGDLDILIQKLLGFALTPLGVVAAGWFFHRSPRRLSADGGRRPARTRATRRCPRRPSGT